MTLLMIADLNHVTFQYQIPELPEELRQTILTSLNIQPPPQPKQRDPTPPPITPPAFPPPAAKAVWPAPLQQQPKYRELMAVLQSPKTQDTAQAFVAFVDGMPHKTMFDVLATLEGLVDMTAKVCSRLC